MYAGSICNWPQFPGCRFHERTEINRSPSISPTVWCHMNAKISKLSLGLSENDGLIFPMIASHFSKRDFLISKTIGYNGVHNIFRHTQLLKRMNNCIERHWASTFLRMPRFSEWAAEQRSAGSAQPQNVAQIWVLFPSDWRTLDGLDPAEIL